MKESLVLFSSFSNSLFFFTGKLKALSKKDEKEFGSGSDISSASISSNMSAFAKAARKRALSRDRGTSKEREKSAPPKKPEEANQPFDKYFDAASKSGKDYFFITKRRM